MGFAELSVGRVGQLIGAKLGGVGFVGGGSMVWAMKFEKFFRFRLSGEVCCLGYYHVKPCLFCMLK